MLRQRFAKLSAGCLLLAAGAGLMGTQVAVAAAPPVAVTAPVNSLAAELNAQDVNTWLDGLVPTYLNSTETPGAVVTVVKDGQVVTTRGYGYADVEGRVPVTGDTLFQVGSVSKIPTTIAALQLVEQGKLDLDADISTYVDVPLDKPVTLRNLLTHTAGFEERVGHNTTYEEGATFDLTDDTLVDPPKQVFEPGTVTAYSNYGMQLVGYIIQEVTGTPFEQHIQEAVFAPAGMDSSSYQQPLPADLAPRMATGYNTTGEQGRGLLTVSPPAGAMVTSGNDAAKFLLAQLDGRVMSDRVKELAWTTGIDLPFGGQRLGLGYFLGERNGHETVGHGGDTEYFHSVMELYPEENTGIYIAVNGTGKDGLGTSLRDAVTTGFADRYFHGEEPTPLKDAAAVERAKKVAGSYVSTRAVESNYVSLAMDLSQARLTATEDGGLVLDNMYLEQIEPWVWQDVGQSMTLAADPSGETPNLLSRGIETITPATGFHTFSLYGILVGLGVLVLTLLAWPLGALRKMRALTWPARIARIGALVALVAAAGWVSLGLIFTPWDLSTGVVRTIQALQWLATLAIIPAGWSLMQQIRGRAGWAKILSSTLLLMGLLLVAAVAVSHHMLSWDISI